MVKKVLEYVKKYQMITSGDTIVAGVSGGADSVCLLLVLLEIQKQIPITLKVVHVNHGIRPDAGEDAHYVETLCEGYQIPFYLVEKDVRKLAGEQGISEEEAGRKLRYQSFADVLGTDQGRIAVAHNSNDRAETMLFHLFRGTGLTGAAGIRPVNGNIIRPLLCLEREEIEEWLAGRQVRYCQDSTNEEDHYTRNRIRHHILPYAEQEICSGAVSSLNRAAVQLQEAEEYVVRQVKAAMRRCVTAEGEEDSLQAEQISINLTKFRKEDPYLRGRILLACLEMVSGSRKDLTAAHIQRIEALFAGRGNGEVHLPCQLVVYKDYDLGMIQRRDPDRQVSEEEQGEKEYPVKIPSVLEIEEIGRVEFTVFAREKSQIIPQKTYTKWFDCDKISSAVVFRKRRPGDYLTIDRNMNHKSLQDYFVNEKVPRKERDKRYLLADGSHIIWVPGLRISEYYKIDEKTQNIVQVHLEPAGSKRGKESENG